MFHLVPSPHVLLRVAVRRQRRWDGSPKGGRRADNDVAEVVHVVLWTPRQANGTCFRRRHGESDGLVFRADGPAGEGEGAVTVHSTDSGYVEKCRRCVMWRLWRGTEERQLRTATARGGVGWRGR